MYKKINEGLYNEKTFDTPATPEQTLWLLSKEEANNISFFVNDDARLATSLSDANAHWSYWLRTPENADNIDNENCAGCVWYDGCTDSNWYINCFEDESEDLHFFGIRPAFQITIG